MADDIVTRLLHQVKLCGHSGPTFTLAECRRCEPDLTAANEIQRLRAVLDAVDDLHSCRIAHDTCVACDHDWPRPTHQLIHPEEARRG